VKVVVATLGRPHGVAGQVTLRWRTDRPDLRFYLGAEFELEGAAGPAPTRLTLASYRPQAAGAVAGFEQVGDRAGAEALRGASLVAEVDPVDEPDAWYASQLRGARVELPEGQLVGVVRDLLPGAAQDLLQILQPDGSLALIPLVEALVPLVDAAGGRIVVDPPAGLVAARPAP
jgi:16S rRNA processing protein RimM